MLIYLLKILIKIIIIQILFCQIIFYISRHRMAQVSQLKQQIGELCQLILTFEKHVEPDRQKLFTNYAITDDSLWNYVFGADTNSIGKDQIYFFMHKHHFPIVMQDCYLLCHRYSSYRNCTLNKQDFWQMFKPKAVPMMDTILKAKKAKSINPKLMEIKVQAKQLIISILEKTIQYEKHAKTMKQNIAKFQQQYVSFNLKRVQSKYLQLYLVDYLTQIRIKDCELLLSHIVGESHNKQKFFYIFFLPQIKTISKTNPINQESTLVIDQSNKSMELFHMSNKIWNYGNNYKNHRNPLYLI